VPLKKLRDFRRRHLAPIYLNSTVQRWTIGIVSAIILALLLSPGIHFPPEHYQVGDVASADVKSTQDFLVEDESVTLKKRIEAEMAVPSVYDYDPSILQKAMGKMRNSFSLMRGYGEPDEVKGREEERKKEFEELLGIPLTRPESPGPGKGEGDRCTKYPNSNREVKAAIRYYCGFGSGRGHH
jgi:membrane-associated HD superfamily phosphohydrolase